LIWQIRFSLKNSGLDFERQKKSGWNSGLMFNGDKREMKGLRGGGKSKKIKVAVKSKTLVPASKL